MDEFDRRISKEMKRRVKGISMTEQEKQQVYREISRPPVTNKKRNIVIWTVATAAAALFLLLALPLLQESKTETGLGSPLPEDFYEGMEGLQLRVLSEKELENGETEYMIEVNNATNRLIREAMLYMSFDIKLENGRAGNQFKQPWRLGHDLEAGQKIEVPMVVDTRLFDSNQIDRNYITLELIGYLDELEPRKIFHVGQGNSNVEGESDRQWKKL
ncbi:hypothetical protein [Sporosarcina obsidiansis]|uniref:hypothetical protein n=1 Tax=Sporosarcina obsidiansis TaxID=2660748 RepID=UPI00129A6450|nr:hypothetical protein [Sporosarcina obsidiansis]